MNEFRTPRSQPRAAGLSNQQHQVAPQQQQQVPAQHYQQQPSKPRRKLLWIILSILAIILVAGSLLWWMNGSSSGSANGQIDSDKYQAVFFTNGQVYFGKLTHVNEEYFKLEDVFYLQTQSEDKDNPQEATDAEAGDVQLIKLGSELHGPEDEMTINKSQLLFFENITDDGDVAKSIDDYKQKQ